MCKFFERIVVSAAVAVLATSLVAAGAVAAAPTPAAEPTDTPTVGGATVAPNSLAPTAPSSLPTDAPTPAPQAPQASEPASANDGDPAPAADEAEPTTDPSAGEPTGGPSAGEANQAVSPSPSAPATDNRFLTVEELAELGYQFSPPGPGDESDELTLPPPGQVEPLTTYGYKPPFPFDRGLLIHDNQFFTRNDMTIPEIRAFINHHGRNCTSQGDHKCLKDYRVTTVNEPAHRYCSQPYVGAPNEDVATILWKTSNACGVSVRALLVLMQKEQGLVAATRPKSPGTYQIAMGYGCPDGEGAVCDSDYFGLANQIYLAAQAFQRYRALPERFNFRNGQTANVLYHPNRSCGTRSVTMKSAATAGLYNYTPYTPNDAALRVGTWVEGDGCSAYGNRNFVYIYSEWFGDPRLPHIPGKEKPAQPVAPPPAPPVAQPLPDNVRRLAGRDRYATAAAVADAAYPNRASTVYLNRGDKLYDALPATVLTDGPVLLVPPGKSMAPDAVQRQAHKLRPSRLIALGDSTGVADALVGNLRSTSGAGASQRLVGPNRVLSAIAVSWHGFPRAQQAKRVYLTAATGSDGDVAIDAVAGGALPDGPLLYVDADGANQRAVAAEVRRLGVGEVVVLGGEGTVPSSWVNEVRGGAAVRRLAGKNRYETAVQVADYYVRVLGQSASRIYLVRGDITTDAVLAGTLPGGPVLLAQPRQLPATTRAAIASLKPQVVTAVGGEGSVSNAVLGEAGRAAK
ncbi:cell wall-binding repeat-containing protein [Buchananella hordeovulneris]|uniref:cell wall-binding repeat-containing protein n=1 Tax=Buchananella hordeovulneris TaxID=52770 RepID=UPI000F5E28E6|nr:cell wall-binding repeat-containing protein [Buchananella hordeovulneris]RRD43287.1 hypothetical protein EII13_07255 [Buchananella hordeovulneris]